MKKNLPITNRNITLQNNTHIVSTTNEGGQITYANNDFCAISGFSEEELHLQSHNIIRHPDMPEAAFKSMWNAVKRGETWMGIVKNRCKNGDHYWVNALVTPIIKHGKTTGYQSVRLKPETDQIRFAEKAYAKLNAGNSLSSISLGLKLKIFGAIALTIAASLLPIVFLSSSLLGTGIGLFMGLSAGFILASVIASPWERAAEKARSIIDDPVAMATFTNRNDELGQLVLAQSMLSAQLQAVVWRLNDSSGSLETAASHAALVAKKTASDMNKQKSEVEQVASAMTEMASTVNEVAQNAAEAAQATEHAEEQVRQGKAVVNEGINTTKTLAQQVQEAVNVIASLADVSEAIGGVVAVIRSIAEQTNLLALNAAIEAARAGEQGRGFAVVADEVRSLASKTQSSTDEIQSMIQQLQTAADKAVTVMAQGKQVAENSVEQSALTGASLDSIANAVNSLAQMVLQIASAAEEQGLVAEEINRNICNINEFSDRTQQSTEDSHRSAERLTAQVQELQGIVSQYTP